MIYPIDLEIEVRCLPLRSVIYILWDNLNLDFEETAIVNFIFVMNIFKNCYDKRIKLSL